MGPVLLRPANSRLRTRSTCNVQRSLVIDLLPEAVQRWFDAELEWSDHQLTAGLDIAANTVRLLMRSVIDELSRPGFGGEDMVELLLAQVCLNLTRHSRDLDLAFQPGGLAPWRVRRLDELLAATSGNATIAEIAKHCALSPRHLSRAFRASYGKSLGQHLSNLRLEAARRRLCDGVCIKEVAFAAGFTAPSNFATAFRRATGMSPREYRNGKSHGGICVLNVMPA